MKRFPYGRASIISAGAFTSSLTWSVYSVYVPLFARRILLEVVERTHVINTLVGIIMILDNIAALFIQPYIGELSDRIWIPKLGRRMPFIILGIPLAATFFGLIGTFNTTLYMLLLVIVGFNISMAFYKTPVMSLMPDFLPKEYRSQGSSVLSVVSGFANLTGLLVSSYFYKYHSSKRAFWVISCIMIVCLIILVLGVREKKDVEIEVSQEKVKILKSLKNMFTETDKTIIFMLAAIFFGNAGYYVGETFLSSYVSVVLIMSDYSAAVMLGVFMGFVILAAIPAGLLGRKIGPLNATIVGMAGFIIGITPVTVISIVDLDLMKKLLTLNFLTFGWEAVLYGLIIMVIGFCYILFSINGIVVIWDMAPKKRIATYTGYFYVFTSLAAIISPFLAGVVFDVVSIISGKTGLKSLFVYVTSAFVIALFFVARVKVLHERKLREEVEEIDEVRERLREIRKRTLLLPSILFGQVVSSKDVRKLRRLQRRERKDLRDTFELTTNGKKEERHEFRKNRRKMRKTHKSELKRFRRFRREK